MVGFFIVLLLCQLAGEVIVIASGVPLPGPVIGMTLLFIGSVAGAFSGLAMGLNALATAVVIPLLVRL
jgi:holin-like protein